MQNQQPGWQPPQQPQYPQGPYPAYGQPAYPGAYPPPYPPKKKSNLWLILGLSIGVPLFMIVLFVGAAVAFTASAETTTASAADRRSALTVDDLGPFIEGFQADKSKEVANRIKYIDGSYEIEYMYEDDELYLESYVAFEPNASDAKYSYTGYQTGTSIGYSISESTVTEEKLSRMYDWGDECEFYLVKFDGLPGGNRLIARKGSKVVSFFWSGVYFDDAESLRELLDPVMARIDAAGK